MPDTKTFMLPDWQVSDIPAHAIRIGQVRVRQEDTEYSLYAIPNSTGKIMLELPMPPLSLRRMPSIRELRDCYENCREMAGDSVGKWQGTQMNALDNTLQLENVRIPLTDLSDNGYLREHPGGVAKGILDTLKNGSRLLDDKFWIWQRVKQQEWPNWYWEN